MYNFFEKYSNNFSFAAQKRIETSNNSTKSGMVINCVNSSNNDTETTSKNRALETSAGTYLIFF